MKPFPPLNKVINYLRSQPPSRWCALTRDNGNGQHCVLGHVDAMLGTGADLYDNAHGIDVIELVAVNNGTTNEEGRPLNGGIRTLPVDGKSIKARVLDYLRKALTNVQG